jgi:hypothetical protein
LLQALLMVFACIRANSRVYEKGLAGSTGSNYRQISPEIPDEVFPAPWYRSLPTRPAPFPVEKRPGHYTSEDWAALIDSIWGPGPPVEEKLTIFNTFWEAIDLGFACFQGLTVDWDSIATVCRAEILDTVSRGRLCAMMQHATMSLMDHTHTSVADIDIFRTEIGPGIPILINARRYLNQFGAGLTPMPDSTVFVYKVLPSQPFGLEVGDVILGYDGYPWTYLLEELMEAQLPFIPGSGSSESSTTNDWLHSVGMNWHLFDTIDIVKYQTGDTVHLPTSLMIGYSDRINAYEQLDIPGVPRPDYATRDFIEWGIIEGSRIGYIYTLAWDDRAETEFYNALDSLMHVYETDGLIIDSRVNYGGNMWAAYRGFELLFNFTYPSVGFVVRAGPNHFDFVEHQSPWFRPIYGDPATYYDKPIAVLTGPGSGSAGDQVPFALTKHPMVRTFGRPTMAAFNAPGGAYLGTGWWLMFAYLEGYEWIDPTNYLTHDDIHIDEPVWLTPEMVLMGKDDVVEAAIAWILGEDADGDGLSNIYDNCPYAANPDQEDSDLDMVGDSCDLCTDTDGDEFGDPGFPANTCTEDNCPVIYNPNQEDYDTDLIGDSCDFCTDTDGDAFGNPDYPLNTCILDNCPNHFNPDQTDRNDDGIGDACCCGFFAGGFTGNANCSEDGKRTLSDISRLIDFVYISKNPLCCEKSGNVNGSVDGEITLSDITRLIDYVYISKEETAACE